MNPLQKYTASLKNNYPLSGVVATNAGNPLANLSTPAKPVSSTLSAGGMSKVPVSSTAATSPTGTKITPSTNSSQSIPASAQAAAQQFIQMIGNGQTGTSSSTSSPLDVNGINTARANAVANGQNPYSGAGATDLSNGAGLGNVQNPAPTQTAPTSPYASYVDSLKESRDALNNSRLDLAKSSSAYTTASTQAHQNTENILNTSGGLLGGAQQAAQMQARHDNANLANLADIKNADANVLSAQTGNYATQQPLQIGNTYIDPKTGQILSNKPEEITPGSGLYNTATGQYTPGTGASPTAITSYAQTLKQNDQMTGNLHLTPQGTVDDNYYYQQASAAYGGQGGSSAPSNAANSGGSQGGLPQNLQPYVTQSSTGQNYINEDKVPAAQKDFTLQQAALNGVPVLNAGEVDSVRNVDYVKQNLQGLQGVVSKILKPGLLGRIQDASLNPIKSLLQSDTDISTFNGYRDTAIKIIQSLAGGAGSGLRLTGGEIATATGNIPTITDNLETAQNKINLLNTFLDTKMSTLFGKSQSSSGGSGTIQTKYGAIDPNL